MSHIINNVQPSTSLLAFNCPHCGAYTSQVWYKVVSSRYNGDDKNPKFFKEEHIRKVEAEEKFTTEQKQSIIDLINKTLTKKPFLDDDTGTYYQERLVNNLNLSVCYHCNEISIWVHEKLIYPTYAIGCQPNNDMPERIRNLYNEAREIVNFSPMGAAALLRLCIQYLCISLGEDGKNINSAISSLVKKGLNPMIQKSLDIVRVIGNEAVHPGVIDLNDNRDIALQLFKIINIICEQMITNPNTVTELYNMLPEEKRKSIEQRDTNK